MGADVSEAEEASDEVMAAIAAGGTYSFVPEPDDRLIYVTGELPGGTSLESTDEAARRWEAALQDPDGFQGPTGGLVVPARRDDNAQEADGELAVFGGQCAEDRVLPFEDRPPVVGHGPSS